MKLKVFCAGSMAEALAQVKQTLGAGAVILHTRTYKRGGILGLGARKVVEVTAVDSAAVSPRKVARKPERRTARTEASSAADTGTCAGPAPRGSSALAGGSAGDLIRRTYAVAKAELARAQRPAALNAPALGASPLTVASPAGGEQLAQEMRAVKRMVGQMFRQNQRRPSGGGGASGGGGGDLPDKLFDQYLTLLKQEVTEELAEEVVQLVRSVLTPREMENEARVRQAVLEAVSRLIPGDEAAGRLEPTPDGRPRTIALIGPTGVGKTTTIAKLAATFKLKQKKNVGLITLDTYRIAAVDQLRTYANIIGVPLHVVCTPEEMGASLRKCAAARCDAVLIDTAGRSQRDDPRLDQLAAFLRRADPHEVHLVFSSTCTQAVLLDTVERFARVRTDRIIFTKLDEAVSFGVLLNVARKVNKRLSFVTTGQEVPHHIEPGSPRRLAALVMGEGGEWC